MKDEFNSELKVKNALYSKSKPKVIDSDIDIDPDLFVAKQLKHLRLKRNLTQVEVATCLGVSFQQVQKYEKGTNRITTSTIFKLCSVLKVNPSYFFSCNNYQKEQKTDIRQIADINDADSSQLSFYFNSMNSNGKKKLLLYAEQLYKRHLKENMDK